MFTNPQKLFQAYLRQWLAILFYSLCGVATQAAPGDIKIEAEAATLNGVNIVTDQTGYSGTGYAWNFDQPTDNIVFPVNVPTAGEYTLTIAYTSPYGDKYCYLNVNAGATSEQKLANTGTVFGSANAGKFTLTAGTNSITITDFYGYYGIDYIVLTPVVSTDLKVEAEAATLNGVSIVTDQAGYSGTGYAWNFDQPTDNIVFSVNAPTAGNYDLTIVYYSPYGEKYCYLNVNAGSTTQQKFMGTGAAFSSVNAGTYALTAGANSVTITDFYGYYGIDYIVMTPVSVKPPTIVPLTNGRLEAELGDLTGVETTSSPAGFSGTGFVTGFDGATDKVTLTFNGTAGLHNVTIGYTSPFGDKSFDIQVNDDKGSGMFAATTDAAPFSSVNAGKFLLKDGQNTITLNRGWGYFGFDYIQLTPTSAPLPAKPPKILADSKATPSTRSLFSYMVDLFGNKVLSAQHDDVAYVQEKTGKEPAIASWDFIEYSPSRVQYGSNPTGESESHIAWAKKNEGRGIISMMWHWNAPTDLINQAPDKLWWRGFYTDATTFDIAAVLADKSGERYQLLLRDIDVIAAELKKFQAADIPVLWRPLHEAPGGYFWWGAKGSGPFKELWRIMYDRLTNQHNLHNLIWVYSGNDTINGDWYPGDAYVDVVGEDIYTDPAANLSGNWENAKSQFNGKKLIALTETGNLDRADYIRGFATWWSWFTVWTGTDYIRKQPLDLLNAVYHDQDVITRDELPDWRSYGQISLKAPTYNCQTGAITFNSTGGDGTPIEYMAIGIKAWSTDPNGVVDAAVRNDPKIIQLLARQNGLVTSFAFDLPNACSQNPPPTSGTFAMLPPTYSCTTGAITFHTSGGNGGSIEYMAVGIKSWSTDANGTIEAGLRGDPKPITLLARQNGVTVQYVFDLPTACPTTITQPVSPTTNGALTLLAPTYTCSTGAITFNAQGGNGTPIEYMAVGIKSWSINPNGIVEAGLRGDPKVVQLLARQGDNIVSYTFDLPHACPASARLAAEATESLKMTILGNPVQRELTVDITGANGQPVQLQLTDLQGRQLHNRRIEQPGVTERATFFVGQQQTGMLLLRASTATQTKTIKVVKE